MTAVELPEGLRDNPYLDRWAGFEMSGRVRVATGKVELGQGVLTAVLQMAADELDVSPERIDLQSGDTDTTPDEGLTAGSQSIEYGGKALRMACAEIRLLFLEQAAALLGCAVDMLSVNDGVILYRGEATAHSYWTLVPAIDLAVAATGRAPVKPRDRRRLIGRSVRRVDLAGKVFGQPVFIHDLTLDGMRHARILRQPRPGTTIASIDEARIRRLAKGGAVEIVRHGNFVAVIGDDETTVERVAGSAGELVTWGNLEPVAEFQQEARWLLQRPTLEKKIGAAGSAVAAPGRRRVEATYSRAYIAHASMAPSCGLAHYRDGHLTVWSHSQGVFMLRNVIARLLKLDPAMVTVRHVQGPGCYGHNGADDAAADAAVVAFLMPGTPIRVRWRRDEEFAFEPVSPAMVSTMRAVLDEHGRPVDWTAEIWSGTHSRRPGKAGTLLAAEAFPDPPPPISAERMMEAAMGGVTRNATPLYDIPAKRVDLHLIPETPVRTSSLRGLGSVSNIFAIECFIDELAGQAGADPVAYRLSLLSDVRARRVIERAAAMSGWNADAEAGAGLGRGIAFCRYKNTAAYAAVVAEVEVAEEVRLTRVWCAVDGGLIVNPDGALNQLEGGIVQATSWALKEQVRFGGLGISSRDWQSYPILRFDEVPEVFVELVEPDTDNPPLGVGEAAGAPTVAAIGNAVSHALGTRIRDLPLTRERVMALLLADEA